MKTSFQNVGNRVCGIVVIFIDIPVSAFVYTSFREIQNSVVG